MEVSFERGVTSSKTSKINKLSQLLEIIQKTQLHLWLIFGIVVFNFENDIPYTTYSVGAQPFCVYNRGSIK